MYWSSQNPWLNTVFTVLCAKLFQSCLTLSNPWALAPQASLSMKFSKGEYLSGLPYPSAGDLPPPGIKPTSLIAPALAGEFFTIIMIIIIIMS